MPRPRPWTDDELRDAVKGCSTVNGVCRRLGLTPGGQTYETLRQGIDRLGLSFAPAPKGSESVRTNRSWSDDELREAVRQSGCLRDVCTLLGLRPGARRYENLRRHIARLDIDDSHLPQTEAAARPRSWTDDDLRDAVRDSDSVSGVLRRLGYRPSGGMHRYIKAKIEALGIDASHFTGQSWSRGQSFPQGPRRRPLADILVKGSTYSSGKLRVRLISAGLKPACCEQCGINEWQGQPLPLALDHINGDPTDNRLENLRILCPNCHSQTDTWCRSAAVRTA